MRIISGKYKGRHIPVRKNFKARPTTDFAKENLFNVLNNHFDFEDLEVLDLFSGTGSISYEFASRGCKTIISIEKDYKSFLFIKDVINKFDFKEIKVIKGDSFRFIKNCTKKFDIIFADPPYNLENLEELPELILSKHILSDDGWFILEHGKNNQFNDNQCFIEKRVYGSVNFTIFGQNKN